jgi:hypothetical protein
LAVAGIVGGRDAQKISGVVLRGCTGDCLASCLRRYCSHTGGDERRWRYLGDNRGDHGWCDRGCDDCRDDGCGNDRGDHGWCGDDRGDHGCGDDRGDHGCGDDRDGDVVGSVPDDYRRPADDDDRDHGRDRDGDCRRHGDNCRDCQPDGNRDGGRRHNLDGDDECGRDGDGGRRALLAHYA